MIEFSLHSMSPRILLYDGVCRLCHRMVQFTLRRDREGIFRFAPLQGELAAGILKRHGAMPDQFDTAYVVINPNESGELLLARSDAVLFILQQLGGAWRMAGFVFGLVPLAMRDWAYRLVARHRYRIFGRYDACARPSEETRGRFLDL